MCNNLTSNKIFDQVTIFSSLLLLQIWRIPASFAECLIVDTAALHKYLNVHVMRRVWNVSITCPSIHSKLIGSYPPPTPHPSPAHPVQNPSQKMIFEVESSPRFYFCHGKKIILDPKFFIFNLAEKIFKGNFSFSGWSAEKNRLSRLQTSMKKEKSSNVWVVLSIFLTSLSFYSFL